MVISNNGPNIYAGHKREEATGLDYMQARWCSSETGTFMSVDPVVPSMGDPQSDNAYAYARNNPMLLVDPTGESPGEGPLGFASWGGPPAAVAYLWGGGAYGDSPTGGGATQRRFEKIDETLEAVLAKRSGQKIDDAGSSSQSEPGGPYPTDLVAVNQLEGDLREEVFSPEDQLTGTDWIDSGLRILSSALARA